MTDTNMPELTLTPNAAAQAEPPQLTLGTEPPAAPGAEERAFTRQGACRACGGTGVGRAVDRATRVPDESLTT